MKKRKVPGPGEEGYDPYDFDTQEGGDAATGTVYFTYYVN